MYCTRREQTERVATLIRTNLKNTDLKERTVTKESLKKKGLVYDLTFFIIIVVEGLNLILTLINKIF